jgi:hypothetical protein
LDLLGPNKRTTPEFPPPGPAFGVVYWLLWLSTFFDNRLSIDPKPGLRNDGEFVSKTMPFLKRFKMLNGRWWKIARPSLPSFDRQAAQRSDETRSTTGQDSPNQYR